MLELPHPNLIVQMKCWVQGASFPAYTYESEQIFEGLFIFVKDEHRWYLHHGADGIKPTTGSDPDVDILWIFKSQ